MIISSTDSTYAKPKKQLTKIQRAVARTAHENLVIFSDASQSWQCFRIARRDEGKLLRSTGLDFYAGHSGEALAQRISRLAISLDEEDDLTLVDVVTAPRRVLPREFQREVDDHLANTPSALPFRRCTTAFSSAPTAGYR